MADVSFTMRRNNGTDYDTLYPKTIVSQVDNGQAQIKTISLSLPASWTEADGYYTQTVTITGGTANTKVDLSANYTTILQMVDDGCTALYVENNNGVFTAYAVGEAPTVALTVYATISEVTPPPRSLITTDMESGGFDAAWVDSNDPVFLTYTDANGASKEASAVDATYEIAADTTVAVYMLGGSRYAYPQLVGDYGNFTWLINPTDENQNSAKFTFTVPANGSVTIKGRIVASKSAMTNLPG